VRIWLVWVWVTSQGALAEAPKREWLKANFHGHARDTLVKDDGAEEAAALHQAVRKAGFDFSVHSTHSSSNIMADVAERFRRQYALEAGLEIFARPPGKRLQSLALLSGGEQALTAMALIFAVFLVNPAPVCVLDEVDAPLDDANVERFCNMLNQMTEMSGTRFLVITHHALTMSRMDRLFGVTMAERGVSQLVSVSLAEAEKIAAE